MVEVGREGAPDRLTVPRTESRVEWADAFLALSNGVVEGFAPNIKVLRGYLDNVGVPYEEDGRSIALLEKVLRSHTKRGADERLEALREINRLRIPRAHAVGEKGRQLADAALLEHGSYAAHFESVCERLVEELKLIEEALS